MNVSVILRRDVSPKTFVNLHWGAEVDTLSHTSLDNSIPKHQALDPLLYIFYICLLSIDIKCTYDGLIFHLPNDIQSLSLFYI